MVIEINTPYKVAGRDFHWPQEYGWSGLGISRESFTGETMKIKLLSSEKEWEVPTQKLLDFIREYGSFKEIKGRKLGIIPIRLLDRINIKNQWK